MYLEFWIVLGIFFIIAELLTGGFFLLSLGLGSFLAAILNYFNYDIQVQIIGFIILTIIFIILSRPLYNRLNKNISDKKSNTERLIGLNGKVTEDINPHKSGFIKVKGEIWKAISEENISKGETVEILKIDGVKLVVKKVDI